MGEKRQSSSLGDALLQDLPQYCSVSAGTYRGSGSTAISVAMDYRGETAPRVLTKQV